MGSIDYAVPGRYRDAFASAEFRTVFGAFVLTMIGTVVAGLALTVLVYGRTGSSLLAALTFTMMFLPYLFGGALLSGLVDRVPPRGLLVGCDLASAGLVGLMTVPGVPVPALFGLLFAMSLLTPLSAGTRSALLPDILAPGAVVPGRSLLRLVAQSAQVAGYAAGGGLLAGLSPRAVLAAEAGTFLISALVLRVFLARRPSREAGGRSVAGDSLRGVRDVLAAPALRRVLLMFWLVPFLAVAPEALAAPSVADLGLPPSATGWWMAAVPAGMLIGEVAGVWVIPAAYRCRLAAPLAGCGFVPLAAFALRPPPVVALALLFVCGLCGAYLLGLDQLLLQATPDELLGRAYTIATSGQMATQGMGFATAGAVGELVAPATAIAGVGVAGILTVAVLAYRSRGPRTRTSPAPRARARAGRRPARRSRRRASMR